MKNNNSSNDSNTALCVACFQTKESSKLVVCENGHTQCGKCLLSRVQAIYDEGRMAFESDGGSGGGQICFTCRVKISDKDITEQVGERYFQLQAMAQTKGMAKMYGIKSTLYLNAVVREIYEVDVHKELQSMLDRESRFANIGQRNGW